MLHDKIIYICIYIYIKKKSIDLFRKGSHKKIIILDSLLNVLSKVLFYEHVLKAFKI